MAYSVFIGQGGDVVGPGAATDGGICVFDGSSGKVIKEGFAGASRGAIIYYGASGWTYLPAGGSGLVLTASGAGADPSWAAVAGSGDVVGPASATNNAFAVFDGTTGKLIKDGGTVVPATAGGTGQSSYTAGDLLYASSSTALSKLAAGTAGYVLTSAGASAPVWSAVSATGVGQPAYWGSFWDTTTQTAASTTTAYTITLNSADANNNGVSVVSSSRITLANTGVYNLQISLQLSNADSSVHDATVWLRKNGSDVSNSASLITVPAKHGSNNGEIIAAWNYVMSLTAGDYVEFVWNATDTNLSIQTIAAGASPTRPQSPCVIVTATQLTQIGIGYGGLTSTSSVTIGTGSKTFTTNFPASNMAFAAGTRVRVVDQANSANYVEGPISSYSGYTLIVSVDATGGSGTISAWNVTVAGQPGNNGVTSFSAGSTGLTPNTATTGAVSLAGTLGAGYGGTGISSYAIGDLLYASGATTLSKLADVAAGSFLRSGGVNTAPAWSTLVLPNAATTGDILYASGTNTVGALADVATGQVLTSGGVGAAPSYSANPTVSSVVLKGSTSGTTTVKPAAVAGTTTVTLPGGTTDFSATGGTSQVVKQTTAGGAFTVAQLAASDLSDGTTGSGKVVLDTSPTFQTSLSVPEVRGHSSGTATTIVTLSTNGKIKETNAAATAGVVRDLTTDGTMTVYQRDGTTLGTVKGGTVNDSVGSMATIRAGGLGLTSQATNDLMYASSATQWARIANGTTGQVLTATTSGAPSWATPSTGAMTLLKANSGTTDCSGAAQNLDTYAISGLTMKDTLMVMGRSNDTAEIDIYNSTDSVTITSSIVSFAGMGVAWLGTDGTTTTTINYRRTSASATSGLTTNVTTAWTGSWTLAFRSVGGGSATTKWAWSVYKIAGQ